jgi:hypothetical protein
MNGIDYKFTKEEVEAVAKLIEMARAFNIEGRRLSRIIATAFNRNAFKSVYEEEDNN